ncbi:hypothetical protein ACFMPD_02555 [Sedimentitalea sp. HM32M-2]|uniref:hypothetical protein n=1 Tax=Sedimentitalea sp. HM32M-2 TaxID=3351566 RepID=UPI0036349872
MAETADHLQTAPGRFDPATARTGSRANSIGSQAHNGPCPPRNRSSGAAGTRDVPAWGMSFRTACAHRGNPQVYRSPDQPRGVGRSIGTGARDNLELSGTLSNALRTDLLVLQDTQCETDLVDTLNRSHAAAVVIDVRAGPLPNSERSGRRFEMARCPILILDSTDDVARAVKPEI